MDGATKEGSDTTFEKEICKHGAVKKPVGQLTPRQNDSFCGLRKGFLQPKPRHQLSESSQEKPDNHLCGLERGFLNRQNTPETTSVCNQQKTESDCSGSTREILESSHGNGSSLQQDVTDEDLADLGACMPGPSEAAYGLGEFEFQALCGGDERLECSIAWKDCTKYPGHEGFIPLPDFGLQHLPERFGTEDYVDYVKTWADLVVRLRITASPRRPKDDKFAQHGRFTGSAYIHSVDLVRKKCTCKECKARSRKDTKHKSWRLLIGTAAHSIFDDYEAENVRIDIFYDSQDHMQKGLVKTLRGAKFKSSQKYEDYCHIVAPTHDKSLGEYLMKRKMQVNGKEAALWRKPKLHPVSGKVMVCISHPHGRPKQITVGELRKEEKVKRPPITQLLRREFEEYTGTIPRILYYTTRTCEGSSGGLVLCLDTSYSEECSQRIALTTHLRATDTKAMNAGYTTKWKSFEKTIDSFLRYRNPGHNNVSFSDSTADWTEEEIRRMAEEFGYLFPP